MPFPTVVPLAVPDWEIDIFWPSLQNTGISTSFQTAGYSKYAPGALANVWNAKSGAATDGMTIYNGILAGYFTQGAGATSERVLGNAPSFLPIAQSATWPAGFKYPSQYRIWWYQFAWAATAGVNYTDETGFAIEPAAGTAPGWMRLGNRGFGIVGNSAGGWMWAAKNVGGVGVWSETVALTWPNAIDQWTVVDFVIKAATGSANASVSLYLNSALQLTRSWGAGTVLPDYSSPANAACFIPHFRMGDGALSGQMNIAAFRYRAGQYNIDGSAV